MSNLTEKWKNRELEDREYYIKSNKGDTYIDICADGNFMFTNYRSIEEVLAPVPSYEVWEEKQKALKVLAEAYCKEKEENKKLKAKLDIAVEGLITILNDGDDYWDKCRAQWHLDKLKEIDK